jgi:hypothetical protein
VFPEPLRDFEESFEERLGDDAGAVELAREHGDGGAVRR